MFVFRLLFLWGLVCLHVLGAAVLFRRLLPRESPWFAMLWPSLLAVAVCNFIEHNIALPELFRVLPLTSAASAWLLATTPRRYWRLFRLPVAVFLGAFAFTFFLKILRPDIWSVRDGVVDLSIMADYCMGDTVPPVSTWMPPYRLSLYYALPHYGASVLTRLLGVDVGTGFNMSAAFLSALVFVAAGGVAWRLGRGRVWIVVLTLLLVGSSMTGSTACLWLAYPGSKDPDDTTNLLDHADDPAGHYPFAPYLHSIDFWADAHELIPPGYYTWSGGLHSVLAGQFLVFLAVLCLVEMTRRGRSDIAWFGLPAAILFMIASSTWGVLILCVFLVAGVGWCWWRGTGPRRWKVAVVLLVGLLSLLSPTLLEVLLGHPPDFQPTTGDLHTQWVEFAVQWWPIYLPWLVLLFYWRRVAPAVNIMLVATPLFFLVVENYTMGLRTDMTGKLWGDIWTAAFAVMVPTLAVTRSWFTRGVLALWVAAAVVSWCFWIDFCHRSIDTDDIGWLAGDSSLRDDGVKDHILKLVSGLKRQIIVPGRSIWSYNQSPMLGSFSGNFNYVAWSNNLDFVLHPDGQFEGARRESEIDAFYDGKTQGARAYLERNKIAAMVVWPEDQITGAALAALQRELARDYVYIDCKFPSPDAPNAGVFLQRAQAEKMNGLGGT